MNRELLQSVLKEGKLNNLQLIQFVNEAVALVSNVFIRIFGSIAFVEVEMAEIVAAAQDFSSGHVDLFFVDEMKSFCRESNRLYNYATEYMTWLKLNPITHNSELICMAEQQDEAMRVLRSFAVMFSTPNEDKKARALNQAANSCKRILKIDEARQQA